MEAETEGVNKDGVEFIQGDLLPAHKNRKLCEYDPFNMKKIRFRHMFEMCRKGKVTASQAEVQGSFAAGYKI